MPPASGSKGFLYLSFQVIANAPSVRPWKPRLVATIFERPVADRANFMAASLASVPELHSQTLSTPPGPSAASFS